VAALADAAIDLAELVAEGPLAGALGEVVADSLDGDGQKLLDRRANEMFLTRLAAAPVRAAASEELPEPVVLAPDAACTVAFDPLDGSSNIEQNASLGSVFAILPATAEPADAFRLPGHRQLAAGLFLYGPSTTLALTLRDGTHRFILDRKAREFRRTHHAIRLPEARREYAINASNERHWPLPIRAYVEECIAGATGPRGVDYNTRWLGCVVAEAYRILLRGGIYLYPGDDRPGYERGRLRLVYEANPIALLVEQAGGTATDGFTAILDLVPTALHQRVPLIFGSRDKVMRVTELHTAAIPQAGQRPLFGKRSLFTS
jgi:fructose-1,6-bisphosphatase I